MISFPASRPPAQVRRRLAAALFGLAMLAACSPTYDWREIHGAEDGYIAMMPARPARLTRPIDLDGLKVSMSMQGARVEGLAFTVGEVVLPDDTAASREHALAAMRTAMVRNIGGRESSAEAVAVPVVDTSGSRVGSAPGWRVEAAGRAQEREVTLLAVFAARGARAWQAVVLGPSPDREQSRQFLEGFRLVD